MTKMDFLVHDICPASVIWGTVLFVAPRVPPVMTSNPDACFHHHWRGGKKRDTVHVVLEDFCLTPDWGNESLSLPRRKKNGVPENTLDDHTTPHSST